ncbi:MAG: ABC transporter substrate-binding protein [Alphaproteobacteria bacterium]|nr:MAG: ABC transporter substrate-binding protein [Alphaproteobacteria bacterium]
MRQTHPRRNSRALRASAILLCAIAVSGLNMSLRETGAVAAPARVVSMNLCTDQLALMIARPGQLISVSYLARDPEASALAQEASHIPVNHGQAEEIFLLRPDLVIAGTHTTRTSITLLRKLGIRVEEFPPADNLQTLRTNVRRMGELLERRQAANALLAGFDRRLMALANAMTSERPTIAPYYANAYTSGAGTLVDAVSAAAGLKNLGSRLRLRGTAKLPLEILALSRPDLVMLGRWHGQAAALAHEVFKHPALRHVMRHATAAMVPDRYLICGTPHTARAVELLFEARGSHLEIRTSR